MELRSFVSPKWVPQMGDAADIVADCLDVNTRNIVLAPNRKGIDRVYMSECKAVAFFVGVCNTFNQKYIFQGRLKAAILSFMLKRYSFFT